MVSSCRLWLGFSGAAWSACASVAIRRLCFLRVMHDIMLATMQLAANLLLHRYRLTRFKLARYLFIPPARPSSP
jgi:hypothetical protein